MKAEEMCVVDRANEIQDKWNNADKIGRKAMLKEFLTLPRTFILMETPDTGFPVIQFIPVGPAGLPIDLAKESARRFGMRTDVLFYKGRWYSDETLIPGHSCASTSAPVGEISVVKSPSSSPMSDQTYQQKWSEWRKKKKVQPSVDATAADPTALETGKPTLEDANGAEPVTPTSPSS